MQKRVFIVLLVLSLHQKTFSQTAPHIEGEISISMETGQLTGKFQLSNLPALGKQYAIMLNRGLNLYLIKDSANNVLDYGHDDVTLDYEALKYWLAQKKDTLPLPQKLYISYTGAYPIYKDTLNSYDDMGVMAFNGKTFRATSQARWYPVIYDTKNDKVLDEVTYNIKVVCSTCKAVYINGDEAKEGSTATFASATPRQLMIFAGDYAIQKFGNATFLNAGLSAEKAKVFGDAITAICAYYSDKLKLPFNQRITFLKHDPIEVFNPGRSWGFVVFPTFAVAGRGFKEQVTDTQMTDAGTYAFYAHELAHYYFGTVLRPNAPLRNFFVESTSEYLSVKATEQAYGPSFTQTYLKEKAALLANKPFIPLHKISNPEAIDGLYKYSYGPLLLVGLEKIIGPDKMFAVLNRFLTTPTQMTDYLFFKNCALKAGVTAKEWQQFEQDFIYAENGSQIIGKLAAYKVPM